MTTAGIIALALLKVIAWFIPTLLVVVAVICVIEYRSNLNQSFPRGKPTTKRREG